ncbi:hypothetical protein V8C26DRAFT_172862 [Trichoderma gracile]
MESLSGRMTHPLTTPELPSMRQPSRPTTASPSYRSRPNSVGLRCRKEGNSNYSRTLIFPKAAGRQVLRWPAARSSLSSVGNAPLAQRVIRRTRNDEFEGAQTPGHFPRRRIVRIEMLLLTRERKLFSCLMLGSSLCNSKQLQLEAGCRAKGLARYDIYNAIRKHR